MGVRDTIRPMTRYAVTSGRVWVIWTPRNTCECLFYSPPLSYSIQAQEPYLCHTCSTQGTLQFVILKPILASLSLILFTLGLLDIGDPSPTNGWLYIALALNETTATALFFLLQFYLGTKVRPKTSILQPPDSSNLSFLHGAKVCLPSIPFQPAPATSNL